MVDGVVRLLRIQASAKNLELKVDTINGAIVNVDPTRLSQVFINLIGNAIKFTDEGSITVTQWSPTAKLTFQFPIQALASRRGTIGSCLR